MYIDHLNSPVGLIELQAQASGLHKVSIVKEAKENVNPNSITEEGKNQLRQYFNGEITTFNLPYLLESGSEFYQKVWKILQNIPYGKTVTYLDIARQLGDPNATRAVGMANGKNPIAICIPCHRVIGSNGSLTGYAYGTKIKRQLLSLENPKEYAINGELF
ncbi:methylated-DNA--[protein]-cysteine S-methyltransferase [Portibacter marinus]|uniref:methylated-DNA--[protein]-cysteine S-methyltransferase n=1 Tax=Portibacter marinus TaxID=2898660 RepID=UPI001F284D85|nr:methylated-DNA--[protein]-cysteine S-methyltransferase [Portibacter marinus]